jgi:hypothetical protein
MPLIGPRDGVPTDQQGIPSPLGAERLHLCRGHMRFREVDAESTNLTDTLSS